MTQPDGPTTLLQGVIDRYRLKKAHIVRVARELAPSEGVPPISRNLLTDLAKGQCETTPGRMRLIVAALRKLTGLQWHASDLFPVEPGFSVAMADAPVAAAPGDGSPSGQTPRWRVLLPEDADANHDESFETLYSQYGVILRLFAQQKFGIPEDEAEAIVHDCFIAWLTRHTYVREPKAWLFGAVKNRCRDYLRARKREVPLEAELGETIADGRSEMEIDQLVRELSWSAVISRLGTKCQETLRGHFFAGERDDELADRLSTTLGYVLQLVKRCRKTAAEIFRSLGFKARGK